MYLSCSLYLQPNPSPSCAPGSPALLDRFFTHDNPRHVVLMRDLQLHLDQTDPMRVRRPA